MPSRHWAVAPGGGLSLAAGRHTVFPAVFTYVPFGHPVVDAGGDVAADVVAGAAVVATRATVVDVDVVLVVVDVVLVEVDVEVVVASSVVDG